VRDNNFVSKLRVVENKPVQLALQKTQRFDTNTAFAKATLRLIAEGSGFAEFHLHTFKPEPTSNFCSERVERRLRQLKAQKTGGFPPKQFSVKQRFSISSKATGSLNSEFLL